MSGRITFSKRRFKASLGKGFVESEWYSQKEQKVMDKSFVLLWTAHSARLACIWHCSNDSEFYRSLPTQRNEAKELSKLELISTHYQCSARILQSKNWWNCVWEVSGKFPQKNWIQFCCCLSLPVVLKPPFIVILPGCPWKLFESEPAVTHFFPKYLLLARVLNCEWLHFRNKHSVFNQGCWYKLKIKRLYY